MQCNHHKVKHDSVRWSLCKMVPLAIYLIQLQQLDPVCTCVMVTGIVLEFRLNLSLVGNVMPVSLLPQ